jgi:PTH2 family peptidyl-tRNA hydrolase
MVKMKKKGRRKMRQLIIARKDLNMSAGKLSAQVSHASMAYFTNNIKKHLMKVGEHYEAFLSFDSDVVEDWILGAFTKTVCEAKNRNHLLKAINIANDLGLEEGKDFFLIKDNCLTELTPEEVDENGVGRTLTCIGFKPLPDDIAHKISKKYQLYK